LLQLSRCPLPGPHKTSLTLILLVLRHTPLQAANESKKSKPHVGQPKPLSGVERADTTLFGRTKLLGEALPARAVSKEEFHRDRQRE
jgi:hypothetical protein